MRLWLAVAWLSMLACVPAAHAAVFRDPFASYADTVLADAPEVYWRLGETAGTTAADRSGHGHIATFASPAEQRTRTGALVGDADAAVADGRVWYASSYNLLSVASASGLPGGASARTLEAWVLTDNAGPQIAAWGDFGVSIEERAIVVAGKRLSLPPDDDRRLTDSRWHHIVVTYDGALLRGYLDGAAIDTQPATLATATTGAVTAARIPAGANVVYDELAIYPRALDAATVAAHFAASGNERPTAPPDVQAQPGANRVDVTWTAATAAAPAGQPAVDHYVVEARAAATRCSARSPPPATDSPRR